MSIENIAHEKIEATLQHIDALDLDTSAGGLQLSAAHETLRTYSLASIALELHEIREQGLTPAVPPCSDGPGHWWRAPEASGLQTCERCNLTWQTHEPPLPVAVERDEGIPHGTARDSADAQFGDRATRAFMAESSHTLERLPEAAAGTRVEQRRHGRLVGSEKIIDRAGTLAAPLQVQPGDMIRFEPTP